MPTTRWRLAPVLLSALTGVVAAPFLAHAHAEVGTPVPALELAAASGGRVKVVGPGARVSVLIFIRTGQDRSVDALKAMARCERALAGKPVRFLAVLPGDAPVAEAQALARATGVRMPLVLDADDALYERLQVRLHPVIFLVDARGQVAAFEQYRQIDYCEVILARIGFLLGELDQAALDRVLEPARNSLPGDDPRDLANREVNLGRRQLKIGQHVKAVASANKALSLAPSAAAFALLGEVAAARGDCPAALRHFAAALRLDPAERHALDGKRGCAGK